MRQEHGTITVRTGGKGLVDITREVRGWLRECGLKDGMLHLFIMHTSASLTVQENADPDVQHDLSDFFERLAPERDPRYRHTCEGSDDMPAHIRTALTDVQLSIPFQGGEPRLGTWQGIYLFEHRSRPHNRKLALHALGD